MLKEKVEKALNEQITKEAYSEKLYLAMAIWAETNGLQGTSNWFYAQADEERMHMLKFIRYVNERGGTAKICRLDEPPTDFKDIFNLFKEVLKHEQYISDSINTIVGITIDERDFSTNNWVQWFVTEQIEEENGVHTILDKLKLIGSDPSHLYLFDKDVMGLRTPPAAPGA